MRQRLKKLLAALGAAALPTATALYLALGGTSAEVAGTPDVQRFQAMLGALGYDELVLQGGTVLNANPTPSEIASRQDVAKEVSGRVSPIPRGVKDLVLGPDSLATAEVCSPSFSCEKLGEGRCVDAATAAQFLCWCSGVGPVGSRLEGLFRSWRRTGTGTCPPASHNGCTMTLEIYGHQRAILKRLSTSDDPSIPLGLRKITEAVRADRLAGKARSQLPVCMRGAIPKRAGTVDIVESTEDSIVGGGMAGVSP